jgi:hypothetical protein
MTKASRYYYAQTGDAVAGAILALAEAVLTLAQGRDYELRRPATGATDCATDRQH